MPPLRIAHIVEATVGGVARHVIDLVTHLDPAAFTSVLYLSFARPESRREPLLALQERGLRIRELPMARVPNGKAVRQLGTWLADDAVDLVHLHSAKAGFLGRLAAKGIPVVYTPHAFPFQRTTDWRRPLYRQIERRLAPRAARIICVSDGEYQQALAAGLHHANLAIIPNGLDIARWPLPSKGQREAVRCELGLTERDLVVGAMGRLTPQKGIDLLLLAAEETLPDYRRAHLLIWGDGPERRALETLARRLRLSRVRFLGACAEPWQAYAAMDVFCTLSRWEAGPYAVLEAMACGLPVLASDVAGHVDYIKEGVTGHCVSTDTPGPFDVALRGLLDDPELRRTLGKAARERVVRKYPLSRMIEETAALYREVCGRS